MKNMVIVGAGPIGLYTAIIHKRAGVKHVTVIDPRTGPYDAKMAADKTLTERDPAAGSYNRPGKLDPNLFEDIANELNIPLPELKAFHIKELERLLYDLAVKEGVDLQKARFDDVTDDGILATDMISKTQKVIPCDLAFDASGPSRVVVNAINKKEKTPPFKIERAADNPVKHNFVAYVKMSDNDYKRIRMMKEQSVPDRTAHAIALENLRTQFGWPHTVDPFYKVVLQEKNKVGFFFTTPPNLKPEQHVDYFKAVLQLKTGFDDIDFTMLAEPRKVDKKPRFLPFISDPHMVTPAHFTPEKGKGPVVCVIGDAQLEPNYQMGIGIRNGMLRIKLLLYTLKLKEGEFKFNFDLYEQRILRTLSSQVDELKSDFLEREQAMLEAMVLTRAEHLKALENMDDTPIQTSFKTTLSEIDVKLTEKIMKDFTRTLDEFNKLLDEKQEIKIDSMYHTITNQALLRQCQKEFITALTSLPLRDSTERTEVNKALLDYTMKLQQAESTLEWLEQPEEADFCEKQIDATLNDMTSFGKNTLTAAHEKLEKLLGSDFQFKINATGKILNKFLIYRCTEEIMLASNYIRQDDLNQRTRLNHTLKLLGDKYHKAGRELFSKGYLTASEECYRHAREIMEIKPSSFSKQDLLTTYCDELVVLHQRKASDETIRIADRALGLLDDVKLDDKQREKMEGNIQFKKAMALLTPTTDLVTPDHYKKAEKLFSELEKNPSIQESNLQQLTEKLKSAQRSQPQDEIKLPGMKR